MYLYQGIRLDLRRGIYCMINKCDRNNLNKAVKISHRVN